MAFSLVRAFGGKVRWIISRPRFFFFFALNGDHLANTSFTLWATISPQWLSELRQQWKSVPVASEPFSLIGSHSMPRQHNQPTPTPKRIRPWPRSSVTQRKIHPPPPTHTHIHTHTYKDKFQFSSLMSRPTRTLVDTSVAVRVVSGRVVFTSSGRRCASLWSAIACWLRARMASRDRGRCTRKRTVGLGLSISCTASRREAGPDRGCIAPVSAVVVFAADNCAWSSQGKKMGCCVYPLSFLCVFHW